MHDTAAAIEARVERFVRDHLRPALERRRHPLEVTVWEAPGEPVAFAEAVRQQYTPIDPGTAWSRPWGTAWFHVTGATPAGWGGPGTVLEMVVDLGFSTATAGFQA